MQDGLDRPRHRNGQSQKTVVVDSPALVEDDSKPIGQSNGYIKSNNPPSSPPAERDSDRYNISSAIAQVVFPEWINTLTMLCLIFGGCCSNVFTLEAIIKEAPESGTLITCFQFILTTLLTLPSHLDFSRGIQHFYLKPRAIPFKRWLVYTALFVAINTLNNKAFHYKISVPLHIILRSAGPVTTMCVQRLMGKRFEMRKIIAVLLLFLGVVLAAVSDARAKSANLQLMNASERSTKEFLTGSALLFLALTLSAFMGVFTDGTYAKYGRTHTEENLFYSHTLSLPFFLLSVPELVSQSRTLATSSPMTVFVSDGNLDFLPGIVHRSMQMVPVQILFLLMNGFTQFLCIRGVNQLAARSSALTVGIVLNIRKLTSLLLSIWLFGNKLAPGVLVGAALVFAGGGLYALPAGKPASDRIEGKQKKEL